MTTALPADLLTELETAGYFPRRRLPRACSVRCTARVPWRTSIRPETTFDGPEVRRHLTVLVLTATHLLVTHLDDDPADALNPSQVVSTTERVRLRGSSSTGLSQVFDTDGSRSPGREAEITLGITWNGSHAWISSVPSARTPTARSTMDTRARIAPSDLALRVSALADGDDAVDAALRFHAELVDAIDALDA